MSGGIIFLDEYFKSQKKEIIHYVNWLLDDRMYYRILLQDKNQKSRDIAEDITQSLFVNLLNLPPQAKQKFLEPESPRHQKALINKQIVWAVHSFINRNQVGKSARRRPKDVYTNKNAKLLGFDELEQRDLDSAEMYQEATDLPKIRMIRSIADTNPFILAEQQILTEKLDEALSTLTPQQQKVLRMRNALPPFDREYTLEEIGQDQDGLTREAIRMIEAKALRKLRNTKNARKFGQEEFQGMEF